MKGKAKQNIDKENKKAIHNSIKYTLPPVLPLFCKERYG
jgi:hypothetical protein